MPYRRRRSGTADNGFADLKHRQAAGCEAVGERIGGRIVVDARERDNAAWLERYRAIHPPSTGSVTPVT